MISLLRTLFVTALLLVPTPAAAAPPAGSYVAIGDSYASGVGAPPYSDTACKRSDSSYPALLAPSVRGAEFRFAACSGAQTSHVLDTQLDGLDRRTRLVTVTIGGNDLGFSAGISACVRGTDAECDAVVAAAKEFSATTLPGRLDQVYREVRQRAPRAELVVAGYPHFFELTADCATAPLSLVKRTVLNSAVDALDATVAARARAAGARFADVRAGFAGHGLCGADPWLTGPAVADAFHPTAAGYRDGYLPAVRRAVTC